MTGPAEIQVELAELLVDTVTHADWAVLAKNGTDAMTACVTIDHLLLKSAGVEEPHLGKVATPAMHAPEPADTTTPPDTTGPSKPG